MSRGCRRALTRWSRSSSTRPPTRSSGSSTGSSPAPPMASISPSPGSMPFATPTPTASKGTSCDRRFGATAIGASTPSMPTCRTTDSSPSNSRAMNSSARPRPTTSSLERSSPPATSGSVRSTARRRSFRRRSGTAPNSSPRSSPPPARRSSGSRCLAATATITSPTRSSSQTSSGSRPASRGPTPARCRSIYRPSPLRSRPTTSRFKGRSRQPSRPERWPRPASTVSSPRRRPREKRKCQASSG